LTFFYYESNGIEKVLQENLKLKKNV